MTRSVGNRKYGRRRSIVEVDKEVVENIGNRDDGAYMHGDIEVDRRGHGKEAIGLGETRRLLLTLPFALPLSYPTDPKEVSHQPTHK
jgi:hypothetical protein